MNWYSYYMILTFKNTKICWWFGTRKLEQLNVFKCTICTAMCCMYKTICVGKMTNNILMRRDEGRRRCGRSKCLNTSSYVVNTRTRKLHINSGTFSVLWWQKSVCHSKNPLHKIGQIIWKTKNTKERKKSSDHFILSYTTRIKDVHKLYT